MLAPMVKVRILGRKDRLERAIEVLGAAGVLHLVDVNRGPHAATEGLVACQPSGEARRRGEALRRQLAAVEEAATLLQVDLKAPTPPDSGAGTPPQPTEQDLPALRRLAAERSEILAEIQVAQRYRSLCRAFAPVLRDLGQLRHVSSLGVTLESRYRDEVLPALRTRLEQVAGNAYQLLWRPLDEDTIGLLILFPAAAADAVAGLLNQESIHEIRLPRKYESLPLQQGLEEVERLLQQLPGALEAVEAELARKTADHRDTLALEHRRLLRDLEQTEVVRNFAATRYLFVIEGYLPEPTVHELRRALEEALGAEVQLSPLPIPPEERPQVPVVFQNPRFFRPFERLLAFLPPPRYGTLDPTPVMALSFPLFFGVILGDVGYGALIVLLGVAVRRRWRDRPVGRDVGLLLAVAGGTSLLFGLVYGELFGDLGHYLGLRPLWRDRLQAAAALLIFTVALGVGHVLLGLLLGVVQSARARLPGKALGNLATMTALVALLAVLGALSHLLPHNLWRVATVVLVAALALLVYLEGMVSLVELVAAIGNILSYSRLMALGIASAGLAMVANQLGGALGNVFAGVAVAGLLHALNLVLGLFSPTLHSLRLHYVEFLPHFYQYGGRAYRPFRKGEVA